VFAIIILILWVWIFIDTLFINSINGTAPNAKKDKNSIDVSYPNKTTNKNKDGNNPNQLSGSNFLNTYYQFFRSRPGTKGSD